ncbi:hypothetical protein AX16_002211 [Volvariella volvacea WC 439]|nr:hypothetical protein AX16_002211 [Volvariella volvacea WC 439]
MFLAGLFLAAFARSYASPVPGTLSDNTIPSPVCIVAAAITASRCDPTRTRTILDILKSCIGVILLCTYISMHHNIPDQRDSRAEVMWMKIRTTLYALMAPEVVIMWAMRQRIMAGRIAEMNKHRGWTRTHGFFIQMGGLVQRQRNSTYMVLLDVESAEIPHIPEKEIKDHGKGDLLAKAIVVLQTTWFVAQCIARHVQGLVLTEIELVTLEFATLNMITYGLWWDKPLNIEYPIYFDENGVRTDGPQKDGDEMQVKEWRGAWYERSWRSVKDCMTWLGETCLSICKKPGGIIFGIIYGVAIAFGAVFHPLWHMMADVDIKNRQTSVHLFYAAKLDDEGNYLAIIYGSVIGVLFGAIHLIGWNFLFGDLLRSSSLLLRNDIYRTIGDAFGIIIIFIGAPLYFAARIILLFLAFFTLRALPESAYENVK